MSIQSLIFNNVELLGYTHQNNFFGENSFNYSATKIISLQGFVLDLQNSNGVDKIFNDVNQIKLLSQNFYEVIINNENYGVGKITSLSFDAGNWVRTTRFNATIEILSTVPLQNLGTEFNNIQLNNKNFNLIKSFNESFSINFDTQNKVLGGEHSIEIEYNSNNRNLNLINLAQSLASELLKTLPTALSEANYNTRTNYTVLNSEDYDLVNNTCGFKRSFSYSTANNLNNPYSVVRNLSINLNQDGIASVSENCEIKAENNNPSLYDNALIGYRNEMNETNIFNRCNDLFNRYKTKLGITRNLNVFSIEKSVQINKFNGTINYTLSFDNDEKKKDRNYIIEYSNIIDRNEQGIWTASENGSVKGVGSAGSSSKYTNAETGWNSIKGSIAGRISGFYNLRATNKSGGGLKALSTNVSRNRYNGIINYNYSYTDDKTIKTSGNITKVSVEKITPENKELSIVKEVIVPNGGVVTVTKNPNNLIKQKTIIKKVTLEIGCDGSAQFNGFTYFNAAKNKVDDISVPNNSSYLESAQFTSDEIEKRVSYEEVYKFS